MSSVAPATSMLLIGRGVLIELMRRKDFYVLLMLMGLYVIGVLVVSLVGIQNPATATFLLNLGMTLAHVASHLLVLILVVRQIPTEIENRTLHPLLARPLARSTLLVGKWAACTGCGAVSLLALFLLGWAPVPRMESLDGLMLIQTLALELVSLGMLAALAMCLSLLVPRGVNLVLMAALVLFGGKVIELLRVHAAATPHERLADWLLAYVPDFSRLNLVTRCTDGIGALGAAEFLGLALCGAIFTAAALSLSITVFNRRAL